MDSRVRSADYMHNTKSKQHVLLFSAMGLLPSLSLVLLAGQAVRKGAIVGLHTFREKFSGDEHGEGGTCTWELRQDEHMFKDSPSCHPQILS